MALLSLTAELNAGRETLGGKALSIVEMLRRGIPVPPAFVLSTDECQRYYQAERRLSADLLRQLPGAVARLETITGRTFGRGRRPLLLSVRSGAAVSMPGMMDTVLNLGITDQTQAALAAATGSDRYAADTRRRFLEQFETVVGNPAPEDPWDQLRAAVAAVFDSWTSDRAVHYRRQREIADHLGTAVTIQAMVFGNLDERSGTGVVFSRDPTGATTGPYGEWLPMGQGEDVVSGRADPRQLDELKAALPEVHDQLIAAAQRLDAAAGEAQDIEFTVEAGRLWLLQCRRAKVHVRGTDATAEGTVLLSGRPACPGFVTGTIVTDAERAEERALDGEDVILARPTTDPHDVRAMSVSAGILTELGGATSHAAIVSRELGVPCIVGVGVGALAPLEGCLVTLNAYSGDVLEGAVPATDSDE